MIAAPVVVVAGAAGTVVVAGCARRSAPRSRTAPLRTPAARRLPARLRAPLVAALDAAMLPCSPEDAVVAVVTAAGVVGLLGFALVPVLAPFLVVLVVIGAPVGLHLARGRRDAALVAALPELVQRVAFELVAGASLEQSITAEADRVGPLAGDLAVVRTRVAHGSTLADALTGWVETRRLPEIRAVAGALGIAADSGAPAAAALHGLARGVRERRAAAAEVQTHSVQARLSAWVVGAAPLGFLGVSVLVDPGSQMATFGTGVGRVCLAGGLALEAVAAWWIRRIVAAPG